MQNRKRITCILGILCAGFLCASAQAVDPQLQAVLRNPQALKNAQEEGRKASSFCVNCHGKNGISRQQDVPNLAGQNADYVLEQTRKFGKGQRKDEFMQGVISLLSEEEKINISLYYASQNPKPGTPNAALVAKGKVVYTRLCQRCHGENAHGNEVIPRTASQHMDYLVRAITRYRDKTGERQEPQMTSATAPLKDADIESVAAYLYSLP
ncbi:MAG: cytochrome c4 [Zoogloeaceae bacterium]|jgi:cytochrome c553|nr:cytochrome c4 [Zoogloeaceae bacterium]